jgi:hypothetical protein
MEGSMRGPSSLDCEKSFARTGIPSANMIAKSALPPKGDLPIDRPGHSEPFSSLVQIAPVSQ